MENIVAERRIQALRAHLLCQSTSNVDTMRSHACAGSTEHINGGSADFNVAALQRLLEHDNYETRQ